MAGINIQEFVNKQNRLNVKRRLLDSQYIRWENTGAGYRPHILNFPTRESTDSTSVDQPVLAIIASGTVLTGYSCTFYADGYGSPSTGSGTAWVIDLGVADSLTTGSRVMAIPVSVSETGGDA